MSVGSGRAFLESKIDITDFSDELTYYLGISPDPKFLKNNKSLIHSSVIHSTRPATE